MFRHGEKVVAVGFDEDRDRVFARLEGEKTVTGQALLYAVGRRANRDQLKLVGDRFAARRDVGS